MWAFTGQPGASFECELRRGTTEMAALRPCTSPSTYDLSAQPDGTYTFTVRQLDRSSNPSAFATAEYTLDRFAPAPPTISSSPGPAGNDSTPIWGFIGETGASFECAVSRGATVILELASCTSPASLDMSAQPDGTYTFSVRAVDGAGNASSGVKEDYTLDRLAPAAPAIESGPAAVSTDASPAWGFSGEPGASFECQLLRGVVVVAPQAACTSPRTYDLSGEPDGIYTLNIRQLDIAGNSSSFTSTGYTLDRVAPAAPVVISGPGPTGSDVSPTWSFTRETGGTFECQLSRGPTVISALGTCTSPVSFDLSTEPDAIYTLSIRQLDDARNASPFAIVNYELDRTAPPAPILSANPPAVGSDSNPAWAFTGEPGATFECQLTRGSNVISALGACTSPQYYDLADELDGTYTFSVRQVDAMGNLSSFTAGDYTLDRLPPGTPNISSGPASLSSDPAPSWSFSGEDGVTFQCQLRRGAIIVAALTSCSSPVRFNLGAEPDGAYTFSVRAVDVASNTSGFASAGYTLDRSAPAPPSIASGPGASGNDSTPTWAFSGEAGASFECQLSRGSTVISGLGSCTSPVTFDLSAEPDGTYTFSVRQTDPAGNISTFATADYALDRSTPPPPTITTSPPASGIDSTPTWTFSGEAGATFQCEITTDSTIVSSLGPCASPFTFDLSDEPNGLYTFRVRQVSGAGNPSSFASTTYQFFHL